MKKTWVIDNLRDVLPWKDMLFYLKSVLAFSFEKLRNCILLTSVNKVSFLTDISKPVT